MIRIEHVSRHFAVGDSVVRALDDVSEQIGAGEHVAIMGPSGSGKSTLLNVIGCLDRPNSGSYQLDRREVSELDDAELTLVRRHMIGFVFQTFQLVPRLSALENVELPMLFAGIPREQRLARAAERIASVGLAPRAEHRLDQLSGGERQRVAIARAMVMQPRVMLADEPTGNLDSRSGAQVLELLDALHDGGLTLIVVTHDPNVAKRAERAIVLVDGRIARHLSADEVNRGVVVGGA